MHDEWTFPVDWIRHDCKHGYEGPMKFEAYETFGRNGWSHRILISCPTCLEYVDYGECWSPHDSGYHLSIAAQSMGFGPFPHRL